ncbi:MAG: glycosyltransferase [Verrucomicrobiota bacterium]|nr:glycosyltransferase [Verrucomicrobiota bacterium]
MKIVHLNAFDRAGGAERVAQDLIELQTAAGHDSTMLVGIKRDPCSHAIAFDPDADESRRAELLANGWPDYEFRGSHQLINHPAILAADVVHAHNLYGGYFHPFSLIALSNFRPLVWSIHDMQPLTGYCPHALDCTRWEIGCGHCPDLTRPGPQMLVDNTAALWRDKELISRNSRLWLAGASHWIIGLLARSLWRQHPLQLVPNGIDTDTFRPIDRRAARQKLGLSDDALIVGSLARGGVLAHPWKGGPHARAVVEELQRRYPNFVYLNLGAREPAPEPWIRALAPESPAELRDALCALDFFLHPAIADTAPLSVLEALACGLPVVAFRVGGIPDFVTENEGILVEPNETSALVAAALQLAADPSRRGAMSASARERAVKLFDRKKMAAGYEELYRAAIAGHPAQSSQETFAREEIARAQEEAAALAAKVEQFRERRAHDDEQIDKFLRHPWGRLGVRLGFIRGGVKRWLRLKAREQARRESDQ